MLILDNEDSPAGTFTSQTAPQFHGQNVLFPKARVAKALRAVRLPPLFKKQFWQLSHLLVRLQKKIFEFSVLQLE